MTIISRVCQWSCLLGATTLTLVSCQSRRPPTAPSEATAFFQAEVRPLLEMNCLPCHNGATLPGRLDLTSREAALAGRSRGRSFLVPGRPDDSLLLTAVSRAGTHPKLMPQRDLSLTEEDIGTLHEWIESGAAWPDGPDGTLRPRPNPENSPPGT